MTIVLILMSATSAMGFDCASCNSCSECSEYCTCSPSYLLDDGYISRYKDLIWLNGATNTSLMNKDWCMYFGRKDCTFCKLSKDFVNDFARRHPVVYFGLDRTEEEHIASLEEKENFMAYHVFDYEKVRSYATQFGIFEIPSLICHKVLKSGDTVSTRLERLDLLSEISLEDNRYPPLSIPHSS